MTMFVNRGFYLCVRLVELYRKMKTHILVWNPQESGYEVKDFSRDMSLLEFGDYPWTLSENPGIRSGDNLYMVYVDEKASGIVMKGFFLTDPEKGSEGEEVYLRPTFMVLPSFGAELISREKIETLIPGLPWGKDAFSLSEEQAEILGKLWEDYISRFPEKAFTEGDADRSQRPVAGIDEAVAIASDAHYDRKDLDGTPVIMHALSVGLAGKSEDEIVCGILHDVMEDSEWTPGKIREKGFPERIIDTLCLLTHRVGVPYMDYIKGIVDSGDLVALSVKLNDLQHNLKRGVAGGHEDLVRKHTEALEYIYKSI